MHLLVQRTHWTASSLFVCIFLCLPLNIPQSGVISTLPRGDGNHRKKDHKNIFFSLCVVTPHARAHVSTVQLNFTLSHAGGNIQRRQIGRMRQSSFLLRKKERERGKNNNIPSMHAWSHGNSLFHISSSRVSGYMVVSRVVRG